MVDARGIIGNYIVERELGRGGMGVVYAAKHRVLGRPTAIKLLLANTSEDRGRVERFFNEARAAMAIDHPGVVKIYDVGIAADDRPYIAMELLDGTALAHHIAPSGLPIRQAIDYACQVASALAAAHDAGVIHRDLKPENVIISRDRSRAIVVDFGVAKLSQQATVRTATGALVGTPLYMSPEQCEGLRELDARSDLYAFGCVIFAMLTGRPPFFEGGPGGVIRMHLHVAPPLLRSQCANASEALERVVSVLLAKSPDARFRTARAVLAALQAPEVRGLAATPGSDATADIVQGQRSVQPWAAATARDAQTMGTGVIAPPGSPAPVVGSHAMAPGGPHAHGPGTAFGVPPSRDAWTQVTGVDVRDPRTAAVQAVGTPNPSSLGSPVAPVAPVGSSVSSIGSPVAAIGSSVAAVGSHSASLPSALVGPHVSAATPTPPNAPARAPSSRRTLLVAILASSAMTAVIAIAAARGCGATGDRIDASVATTGSSDGSNATGSAVAVAIDASTVATLDASAVATLEPHGSGSAPHDRQTKDTPLAGTTPRGSGAQTKVTQPKVAQPKTPKATPKGTATRTTATNATGTVQIDPNGSPLPGERPRNEVPGAGTPRAEQPETWHADQEVVRKPIHDHFLFAKGDHGAALGQRALDRVAANHRLDPSRRIVITGHAEQDEPGVLESLAGARANTAYIHLINRGVPRSVLVMNSTRFIDPVTPNGANRRVNIDFE